MERRMRRIFIIGVLCFLAGAGFFFADAYRPVPVPAPRPEPSRTITTDRPRASDSLFAGYPSPAGFRRFFYDPASTTDPVAAFTTPCHDAFAAFLVFPAAFDYRDDPARAVRNSAMRCPENGAITVVLRRADMGGYPAGTYYAFIAEQKEGEIWYNPR